MLHTDHFSFCLSRRVLAIFLPIHAYELSPVFTRLPGSEPLIYTRTLGTHLPLNTYIWSQTVFQGTFTQEHVFSMSTFSSYSVFDRSAFLDRSEIHAHTQKTRAHIHTHVNTTHALTPGHIHTHANNLDTQKKPAESKESDGRSAVCCSIPLPAAAAPPPLKSS